jgi:RNA polymerase sigma-70 factor (ECF subfamily)
VLGQLIQEWLDTGQLERLECIELLLVLGWRNKDVATELGISEQDVANHKSFVLRKLKDAAGRSPFGQLDLPDFGLEEPADEALEH